MTICLICVEIFAWGKYGGFGRATRTIGRELVKRGHTVYVVVPRRREQRPVETLDGMTVLGFPSLWPWAATRLLKQCNADVYHSCSPSYATHLAIRAMPDRAHIVTVRDPRDMADWKLEYALPSLNKLQVLHNYWFEHGRAVQRAMRRCDAVYAPAKSLIAKIQEMYALEVPPAFLPTPVAIPAQVRKAEHPTVCTVGRLDRRKRPTLFLDLARRFPQVRFISVGGSRDPGWEAELRARYADVPNLEMTGFIDQFASDQLARILEASWIYVNTATREALPNAFLEAAASRCAILSGVDPDGFASQFGYYAKDEDFAAGLSWLLEGGRWSTQGERGWRYVEEIFSTKTAVDQHEAVYRRAMAARR